MGFAIFLWTHERDGCRSVEREIDAPFAVYMFKNRALGWLLGPVGMIVTAGLSLGWFAAKAWRREASGRAPSGRSNSSRASPRCFQP